MRPEDRQQYASQVHGAGPRPTPQYRQAPPGYQQPQYQQPQYQQQSPQYPEQYDPQYDEQFQDQYPDQYADQYYDQSGEYYEEQLPPEEAVPAEAAPTGKRVGHWVGLVMGCAVVGIVIGGVIVGAMKFINGPVTAQAKLDPLEDARKKVEPTPDMRTFGGKDVELRYPSVFDTVGTQQQPNGDYDAYYISSKSNTARSLALTVSPLKSGKLDDDSGYKWRLYNKETYKLTSVSLGVGTAALMTKLDNTEATLFWAQGGRNLALSLTSTDPHDNPAAMMQQIMPTIRWRR